MSRSQNSRNIPVAQQLLNKCLTTQPGLNLVFKKHAPRDTPPAAGSELPVPLVPGPVAAGDCRGAGARCGARESPRTQPDRHLAEKICCLFKICLSMFGEIC